MHEGAACAPRLEIERLVGVAHFELHLRWKQPLGGLSLGSVREERKRDLAGRRWLLVAIPGG